MLSDPVIIEERAMAQTHQHDLADTVGTDVGRLALLKKIMAQVEGLDTTAADDDLDRWWGSVEIDRLASGLTLATIAKLSKPSSDDDPAGPWLRKSDSIGDEPTQLTQEGKAAIRRISATEAAVQNVTSAADSADTPKPEV
jgi:hypothetical protein